MVEHLKLDQFIPLIQITLNSEKYEAQLKEITTKEGDLIELRLIHGSEGHFDFKIINNEINGKIISQIPVLKNNKEDTKRIDLNKMKQINIPNIFNEYILIIMNDHFQIIK